MRRSSRRLRAPRRKTQWLNAIGSNLCSVPLTRNFCTNDGPGVYTPDQFLLVDNPLDTIPGQVSTVGEATLIRLVGEINIALVTAGVTNNIFWHIINVFMGIYITDQDAAGIIAAKEPTLDVETKDWLWRGTFSHSQCGLNNTNVFTCTENDPFTEGTASNGSHIDLRVKRKIRREESIILATTFLVDEVLGPGEVVTQARINGNVRALIMMP